MERKLQTLAGRIALARAKRGMSQTVLAGLAGLKQSDVSKLENGQMQSTTKMAALSRVLRVPSEWLELGVGEEPAWEAPKPGQPVPPPSDFHDPRKVTDSGWAVLQDLADMPSHEREQRIADIRSAAENYRVYLREALGKMKGDAAPSPKSDLYRLPDPVGTPEAPDSKKAEK